MHVNLTFSKVPLIYFETGVTHELGHETTKKVCVSTREARRKEQ